MLGGKQNVNVSKYFQMILLIFLGLNINNNKRLTFISMYLALRNSIGFNVTLSHIVEKYLIRSIPIKVSNRLSIVLVI